MTARAFCHCGGERQVIRIENNPDGYLIVTWQCTKNPQHGDQVKW